MGGIIAAEEVSDIQAGEALATARPDVKVTEEGEGAGPRGVHWLTSNCVCGRIKVTRLLTSDQLATI